MTENTDYKRVDKGLLTRRPASTYLLGRDKNLTVFEIMSHDDSADSKNDILIDDHSSSIKTKNQSKSGHQDR